MLPGIYIGTMGAPDFLREVHIGQTPAVAGHPAVLGASDLDGAIARCREYHVPAMYRGSRLIHGLTVGELVPGAKASDAFPVWLLLQRSTSHSWNPSYLHFKPVTYLPYHGPATICWWTPFLH